MHEQIAMTMVTTDRSVKQRKNYVYDTLKGLESAGVFSSPYYHSLTIHVDSANERFVEKIENLTQFHEAVTVRAHAHKAGSAGNAMRAHKEASQLDGVDWVMMLEDDLLIAEDFLETVVKWLQSAEDTRRLVYQIGVWSEYVKHYQHNGGKSWFDFYGHDEPGKKIFRLDGPTELMRGSQCYLMRQRDSARFATFIDSLMRGKKVDSLIHHDMRIRQWLNSLVQQSGENDIGYVRSPKPTTFVQHVGIESSVYDVKKYIDPSFFFEKRKYPE